MRDMSKLPSLTYDNIGTCAVVMRSRYSHTDPWDYHTEVYDITPSGPGSSLIGMWFNDWDEGQEDVEILDVIDIETEARVWEKILGRY